MFSIENGIQYFAIKLSQSHQVKTDVGENPSF